MLFLCYFLVLPVENFCKVGCFFMSRGLCSRGIKLAYGLDIILWWWYNGENISIMREKV